MAIIRPLAGYLSGGLTAGGPGRYDCNHATPELNYYTFAIAQALDQATRLGLGEHHAAVNRAYEHGLAQQREAGNFKFYSRANAGVMSDRRSYPRPLTMILHHLLRTLPGG
jgi:hypothetical protein